MTQERIIFRLIQMPCCDAQLCWVNPRLPNYCPECGQWAFEKVRGGILISDPDAVLTLTA